MVNSKEFSDTVFTIGGQTLYAHRPIIEVRCPTLFAVNLKDRPTKKGNISYYKIDDKLFDELTLYSVLFYLYTDTVQFTTLNPIDVVMLIKAAEVYELDRLIWLCERYLKLVITDDLFFTLLRSSSSLNVLRAKNICMEYGKNRFGDLIVRREDVTILGIELFREFVVYSHLGNQQNQQEQQQQNNDDKVIESTIQEDMKRIFKERHHCDSFFTFGSEKVEFHKAIILAQSDNILKLLKSEDESNKKLPKEVSMSSGAFESALSYLYYRNVSFNSTHAAEIIPFAKEYKLHSLYEVCEDKIKSDINVSSVIGILSLCYHKDLEKLLKKEMQAPCFRFIANNFVKIDFSVLKNKSPRMIADIFNIIKKQIKNGRWIPKSSDNNSNNQNNNINESESVNEEKKKEDEITTTTNSAEENEEKKDDNPVVDENKNDKVENEEDNNKTGKEEGQNETPAKTPELSKKKSKKGDSSGRKKKSRT